MVTGTIAAVPVAELPAAAWAAPLPAALLDDPPPELQAARVAPVAQQATVIATRVANLLRPCLPSVFLFNSLTVPS
jgi:hypothetical protein